MRSVDEASGSTWWLLMASLVALLSSFLAWPWSIISASVSLIILAVAIHVNYIRPMLRRRKLRVPAKPFFVIPGPGRHSDYAFQDSEEHQSEEITLQSDNPVVIELIYVPRLSFRTTSTIVSFETVKGNSAPPKFIEYQNPFVAKGRKKRAVPGEDTDDYIDIHGGYHRVETRSWSVGTVTSHAFKVQTNGPVVCELKTSFIGEEVEGAAKLLVRVEREPSTPMRCTVKKHKRQSCARSGIRPLKL